MRLGLLGAVLGLALGLAAPLSSAASAQEAPGQEAPGQEKVTKAWAIAEWGEPLYGPDMPHFPYVRPDAPKGGTVTLAAFGGFDSFNTMIPRGEWQRTNIGLISDSLMEGSADEIGVVYGAVAESVEYPEDYSWAIFNLRPEARWHDGAPITAEDVKFAFDILKQHGRPFLRAIYDPVASAEILSPHRIRFAFSTKGKRKPLILAAGMSPWPKHWWSQNGRDPSQTFLEPPLGSGPYRLVTVEPGRRLVYERVPDHWGADLPTNRGRNNFDRIIYDFYRDQTVMFEAFKGNAYDFREETSPLRWATGYDFPALAEGRVVKREIPVQTPGGMSAFFINTRRPHLADPRVREAINHLFDFEWIQKNIFFGYYKRNTSYFIQSEYGSSGLPTGRELELLEPFRDRLPARVFTQPFEPPKTDGSGNIRANQRRALQLFKEAGWELKDGRLVNAQGQPFTLEILTILPDDERWTNAYVENLRKSGIEARHVRLPDTATWERRADQFDFDLFTATYTFFPPPGTELVSRFGSAEADVQGSANMTGIKDPVVDAMLERIVTARDHETLVAATRALDRVLLWGWYVVPRWHKTESWVAYKDIFGRPDRAPKYGVGFLDTWWVDPRKSAAAGTR
ncbi:extracellular solute-binding protein [Arenibaculum pallidiluteum]|uniref:extracellular solute-binding protein n=1 Tax=Arenibaculum pallidiluteum TaxID=2812559 RepID=UPI001A97B674|nr:extracellular solute-binding protein [Arenibaculum pallidiluteum]